MACTVETLYSRHYWPGTNILVLYSEVSLTQYITSGIFPAGVVLRNQAVEHNVATFSELSLAVDQAHKNHKMSSQ